MQNSLKNERKYDQRITKTFHKQENTCIKC